MLFSWAELENVHVFEDFSLPHIDGPGPGATLARENRGLFILNN